MKNKLLYAVLAVLTMSGCITEYEAPHIENVDNMLVVEGIISDGETTIKLSRSAGLNLNMSQNRVEGAAVWVEGEDGQRWESSTEQNPGEYLITVGELANDVRYRLRISAEGQEYESEYRFPQQTPPLEITFGQRSKDEPLQVRLNVAGAEEGARHYLWNYKETWEIHAYEYATHYLGYEGDIYNFLSFADAEYLSVSSVNLDEISIAEFVQEFPNLESPVYYCWKYNNSRELLLGSTDKLTQNELRDHVLYEIALRDDRISQLYHTVITQYALDEDAYFYFENQKKNTDEMGSIFSPVPSEMQGNIVCATTPDIPVIGYVEVSRRVEKEIYLDSSDSPYIRTRPPSYPILDTNSFNNVSKKWFENNRCSPSSMYLLRANRNLGLSSWTYRECFDCRTMGGVKTRPIFWPNDHY